MKRVQIGLVDYEMGNLNSVSKALEKVGASVRWVEMPLQLKGLDALVLPGVGAFSCAVQNLKKRKLFNPIGEWIVQEKPFLGICLGYQLLFEESEEGGEIAGLGIFKGKVKRFPKNNNLKVPHMGWNQVKRVESLELSSESVCSPSSFVRSQKKRPRTKDQGPRTENSKLSSINSKLFSGIKDNSYFYFVHSYFPVPRQKEFICTVTNYGVDFSSSICAKNLFACQFHPEKSGANGLKLLRNFVRSL